MCVCTLRVHQRNDFNISVTSCDSLYFIWLCVHVCVCPHARWSRSLTQQSHTVVNLRAPGTPHYLSHLSNWPFRPLWKNPTHTHTHAQILTHPGKNLHKGKDNSDFFLHVILNLWQTDGVHCRRSELLHCSDSAHLQSGAAVHSYVSCRGW